MGGLLAAQGRPHIVALAFVIGAWCVTVPLAWVFGPGKLVPYFAQSKKYELLGVWAGLSVGYCVTTIVAVIGACTSNWPEIVRRARERAERSKRTPRVKRRMSNDGTSTLLDIHNQTLQSDTVQ